MPNNDNNDKPDVRLVSDPNRDHLIKLGEGPDILADAKAIISYLENNRVVFPNIIGVLGQNNLGAIEITTDGGAALKERPSNSNDAVNARYLHEMDGRGLLRKHPTSTREANVMVATYLIQEAFPGTSEKDAKDLYDQAMFTMDQTAKIKAIRRMLSELITIEYLEVPLKEGQKKGKNNGQTIRVTDLGEGVHADEALKTILSLGRGRSSRDWAWCHAYFGIGGMTACAHAKAVLILSAKAELMLNGRPDVVSIMWIEKRPISGRSRYVVMLDKDGKVPVIPRHMIKWKVPGSKVASSKKGKPDWGTWDTECFPAGCTAITHYDYNLGPTHQYDVMADGKGQIKSYESLLFSVGFFWRFMDSRKTSYQDGVKNESYQRNRLGRPAGPKLTEAPNKVYSNRVACKFWSETAETEQVVQVNYYVVKKGAEVFGGKPVSKFRKVKAGMPIPEGNTVDAQGYLLDGNGEKVAANTKTPPTHSYVAKNRSLFYTQGGVTQAMETGLLFDANKCKLGALRGRMMVEVQLDQLTEESRHGIFNATREGLMVSGDVSRLKESIQNALSADCRLTELAREAFNLNTFTYEGSNDSMDRKAGEAFMGLYGVVTDRGIKLPPVNLDWDADQAGPTPTKLHIHASHRLNVHPDKTMTLFLFSDVQDGYSFPKDPVFFCVPAKKVDVISLSGFHHGVCIAVVRFHGVGEEQVFQAGLIGGGVQTALVDLRGMKRGKTGGGGGSPLPPKFKVVPVPEDEWPDGWDKDTVGEISRGEEETTTKSGVVKTRLVFNALINTDNALLIRGLGRHQSKETRARFHKRAMSALAGSLANLEYGKDKGMAERDYKGANGSRVEVDRTWEHKQQDYRRLLELWLYSVGIRRQGVSKSPEHT